MNRILKAKIVERFGTQADFAQMMRIDETIVSRVVRGRRSLEEGVKKKWAAILEADPLELFGQDLL